MNTPDFGILKKSCKGNNTRKLMIKKPALFKLKMNYQTKQEPVEDTLKTFFT